jgi:hypothetical protein
MIVSVGIGIGAFRCPLKKLERKDILKAMEAVAERFTGEDESCHATCYLILHEYFCPDIYFALQAKQC